MILKVKTNSDSLSWSYFECDIIHFNYEPLNNLAELKDTVVLLDQTEDNQKEKLVAVLNLETAKEHLRTVITDSTCYILNNKGTIIEKIVY